ncbi:putative THAP domain-containing protein 9-like [Apostichopus japonicus]|uniref:Putative THAP domain-containing protein 9-like n=1 Tax=Stichopus japonicus TaxID=307972 RepID=A0A2G8K8R2_STIJA|nr:putative THAP domain-containing protein 9-like [Apostichopus japonicus]
MSVASSSELATDLYTNWIGGSPLLNASWSIPCEATGSGFAAILDHPKRRQTLLVVLLDRYGVGSHHFAIFLRNNFTWLFFNISCFEKNAFLFSLWMHKPGCSWKTRKGINISQSISKRLLQLVSHHLQDDPAQSQVQNMKYQMRSAVNLEYPWRSYYAVMESPRKLKRKLDAAVNHLQMCKKKLKMEQQKSRRLKVKVTSLTSLIATLLDERQISESCAAQLETTLGGVPKAIIGRLLKQKAGKTCGAYPEELRAFAMTLHFYSAKAYNYVRQMFGLALPHPRQIRAWYSRIDGAPGFTKPAFAALEAKRKDNRAKGKETVCAVMLDEVAIRKHVEYAHGQFHGYVDIGSGNSDDSAPVAKDALVLMAVSVDQSWKIPLGYFLINGMSGEERANLINQCLQKLHDVGVRAVSLTCDGPSCHFAMMRHLGAKLNISGMDPSFPIQLMKLKEFISFLMCAIC